MKNFEYRNHNGFNLHFKNLKDRKSLDKGEAHDMLNDGGDHDHVNVYNADHKHHNLERDGIMSVSWTGVMQ